MNVTHVLFGIFTILLTGCANFTTVERRTDLPDGGKAIHLDAPQRVAISNKVGMVCAEPSPDSLQAYASSLGAGISAPSKESVSVAQALSASAGSIGLRTQSITLMRDQLYRICEQFYNGSIDQNSVLVLLERSQDLSLAILAIEQLTGAVVAQQVNINTSSAATAAASINDTQKELDRARIDEKNKQMNLDSAKTAFDKQEKIVADKSIEASTAKENAKATQAELNKLVEPLDTATKELEKAEQKRFLLISNVAGLTARIKVLEENKTEQKARKDVAGVKKTETEAAYQEALTATPPNQELIDELKNNRDEAVKEEKSAAKSFEQIEKSVTDTKKERQTAIVAANDTNEPIRLAELNLAENNAKIQVLRLDPKQALADSAEEALKIAKVEEKKMLDAKLEAESSWKQAHENTNEIAKLGSTATTSANASGGGAGTFSTSTSRYGINKETVQALSDATADIVDMVLSKGHLTDSCMSIFFSYVNNPLKLNSVMERIFPICTKAIETQVEAYSKSLNESPRRSRRGRPEHPSTPLERTVPGTTLGEVGVPITTLDVGVPRTTLGIKK